jgi:hypothetical protein
MPKTNNKKNIYNQADLQSDLEKLQAMIDVSGGAEDQKREARHFKVVELNGKLVDIGYTPVPYETKQGNPITSAPLVAARKLLKAIAAHEGLEGKDKLKLKPVTYLIKETTRDKKVKKIYGPYIGKYRELSNSEKKTAKRKPEGGDVIPFTMKADVHLKKEHHKGGLKL